MLGYRIPALTGPDTAHDSGVWAAISDRDAALTATGASLPGDVVVEALDGVALPVLRVKTTCLTLLKVCSWKFDRRTECPPAAR